MLDTPATPPLDEAAIDRLAARVRFVLTDVDGTLTDGRLMFTDAGDEVKAFHVRDGAGIKYLQHAGIEVGIITGRSSRAVARRAAELGVIELHQGRLDKLNVFNDMLVRKGFDASEVAYLGDDLTDLAVMRVCGLPVAVADAVDEVRAMATWSTAQAGGNGAFRGLAERILKAQGKWDETVARHAALPH